MSGITIRKCSCGHFEMRQRGKLIHIADSYADAVETRRTIRRLLTEPPSPNVEVVRPHPKWGWASD